MKRTFSKPPGVDLNQTLCHAHLATGAPLDRQRCGNSESYLEFGPDAVDVVSPVAAVAEQHVLGVSLAPADLAAGVEQGLGPQHAPLQGGEVEEPLGQAGARLQRVPPPLQHRLTHTPAVTAV